jgi:hypothetical protein
MQDASTEGAGAERARWRAASAAPHCGAQFAVGHPGAVNGADLLIALGVPPADALYLRPGEAHSSDRGMGPARLQLR